MGTVITYTLAGAIMGAIATIILYVLGFGFELCTCGGDSFGIWNMGSFMSILLFCIIGGAIVGLIYSLSKLKANRKEAIEETKVNNSERLKKQKVQWALKAKQKALDVYTLCESNSENVIPLVSSTYEAEQQLKMIFTELTESMELKGKIDALAEDVKKGSNLK